MPHTTFAETPIPIVTDFSKPIPSKEPDLQIHTADLDATRNPLIKTISKQAIGDDQIRLSIELQSQPVDGNSIGLLRRRRLIKDLVERFTQDNEHIPSDNNTLQLTLTDSRADRLLSDIDTRLTAFIDEDKQQLIQGGVIQPNFDFNTAKKQL